MWIKLSGAAALLIATWSAGKRLSDTLKTRCESLRTFRSALVMLESEMSYAGNTIDRAFLNISDALGGNVFFKSVADNVRELGARNAWRTALREQSGKLCLADGDVKILQTLSAELGVSNTENQIKSIRYLLTLLEKAEEEAEQRRKTLSGLYRKLCFGAAAMLIILFM